MNRLISILLCFYLFSIESGGSDDELCSQQAIIKGPQDEILRAQEVYHFSKGSLQKLELHFPLQIRNPQNLQGLVVLDIATGRGGLVKDLRSYGIEAYGLDIKISSDTESHIYQGPHIFSDQKLILTAEHTQGWFIHASA
jgi:hypothetical protein